MQQQILTYDDVTPSQFHAFLSKAYKPGKVDFLMQHGEWLYRGNQHRFIILDGENIAAHSGVIPALFMLDGGRQETVWMMDLVVLPEYRGRGYQRALEEHIRGLRPTTLAFTNQLSTTIFEKHGWGVGERGHYYTLPLRPMRLKAKFFTPTLKGQLVRLKTAITSLPTMLRLKQLADYQPRYTQEIRDISAEKLTEVFFTHHDLRQVTTCRDADYLGWRFLQAPYRYQYRFYLAETLVLVVRQAHFENGQETRLLDIWGDLSNLRRLEDILRTAVRDAVLSGSMRVMGISSLPALTEVLQCLNFRAEIPRLFCWASPSPDVQAAIGWGLCHWSLADSDNDTVG
jgi:GNAT superfamily N-acetyltransferase